MSTTVTRRQRSALAALLGLGTILGGAQMAHAESASISPLDGTRGFNTFVRDDASVTRSGTEGTLAVGGDLTVAEAADHSWSMYSVTGAGTYHPTATAAARGTNLFVGGRVVFAGGRMTINQGFVRIVDGTGVTGARPNDGGQATITPETGSGAKGDILINSGQPVDTMFGRPENAIDFDGAFRTFGERSSQLAACVANVDLANANGAPASVDQGSWLEVYPQLDADATNVLNLTAAQWERIGRFTFRTSAPLVINITDHVSGDLKMPAFAGADMRGKLIINLPNATQVTLTGWDQVPGTIYAPHAQVDNRVGANISGSVIAAGFSHESWASILPTPFVGAVTCDIPAGDEDQGGDPGDEQGDDDQQPGTGDGGQTPGGEQGGGENPSDGSGQEGEDPGHDGDGDGNQSGDEGTQTPRPSSGQTDGGSTPTPTPSSGERSGDGDGTPAPAVTPPAREIHADTPAAGGGTARLKVTARTAARVRGNGTVTYVVVVRNTGTAAAQKVLLVDTLHRRLTYVRASGRSVLRGRTVKVAVGTLEPGQSRTIRIVAKAPATMRGRVVNTARVRATGVTPVQVRATTTVTPVTRRA